MKNRNALLSVLAGTLLLVGCQSVPDDIENINLTRTVLDANPIAVTEARAELAIAAPAGASGLSDADARRLAEFASVYGERGHGPVVMSIPAGGANAATAQALAGQVRSILYAGGVNWDQIAGGQYDGAGQADAPITLSFVRYEAKAPDCLPLSAIDLRKTQDNLPYQTFGCSAAQNLAVMVADPADLLGERPASAREAAPAVRVMNDYKAGKIEPPPAAGAASGGN